MSTAREFRRVRFDRRLDVKRLRAALAMTMRAMTERPAAEAAPARLESVLIDANGTTVFLSGNRQGLDAVGSALRAKFPGAAVAKATRAAALRPPRA